MGSWCTQWQPFCCLMALCTEAFEQVVCEGGVTGGVKREVMSVGEMTLQHL